MAGRPSPGDFLFFVGADMPTAVLIDGGFFLHRYHGLRGSVPPKMAARDLHRMCLEHLRQQNSRRRLYRIFFYDCPPLSKKAHNPVSGCAIDFSQTQTATWRLAFHDELRSCGKVALRLGYLNDRSGHWEIKPSALKALLAKKMSLADLTERGTSSMRCDRRAWTCALAWTLP